MKTAPYRVGVIGATGAVGAQVVALLEERAFPVEELRLLATESGAGTTVPFRETPLVVRETGRKELQGLDLVFLAAGTAASQHWAPQAVDHGAVVIDKSNAFRDDPEVPLVVPEVNGAALANHQGIIASPNCSTIQLVMVLKPIQERVEITRVVVSTYQSVSGTGRAAVDELAAQAPRVLSGDGVAPTVYPQQIAFNLLPHIDAFVDSDYTLEELKLVNETRRILALPDLPLSATCVRVPIFVSHSEAVLIETSSEVPVSDVRDWLDGFSRVSVVDNPDAGLYPTPLEAAGTDSVLVGRIRRDLSSPRGLWLWIVADNLRTGAATNAVRIAEHLHAGGVWNA